MANWSMEERRNYSRNNFVEPRTLNYPIRDQKDVEDAARLIGHATIPESVFKQRLVAICHRLGLKPPASYGDGKGKSSGKSADVDMEVAFSTAIKAMGDGKVGGYLVRFTNPDDTDPTRDYFDKSTDFEVDSFPLKSAVRYHHGLDVKIGKKSIGTANVGMDEVGIWIDAQLNMRDEWEKAIYSMVEQGKLGWSSGTAPHLVEREPVSRKDGTLAQHITRWPLGLDASLTPKPAELRNQAVVSVKSLPSVEWEESDAVKAAMTDNERKKHAVVVHDNDHSHSAYFEGGKAYYHPIPPGDRNAAKVALKERHKYNLSDEERRNVHDVAAATLGDEHDPTGCMDCSDYTYPDMPSYAYSAGEHKLKPETKQGDKDDMTPEEVKALVNSALEETKGALVDEFKAAISDGVAALKSAAKPEADGGDKGKADEKPADAAKSAGITQEQLTEALKTFAKELAGRPVPRAIGGMPAGASGATKTDVDLASALGVGSEGGEDDLVQRAATKYASLKSAIDDVAEKRRSGYQPSNIESQNNTMLVERSFSIKAALEQAQLRNFLPLQELDRDGLLGPKKAA